MPTNDERRHSLQNFSKIRKGAIVQLDAKSSDITNTIYFQYNPDTMTRTLTPQIAQRTGGDRREMLRFKGPPKETIKLDAELDSTGPLPATEQDNAIQIGIYPQLSALETLIYPTTTQVASNLNLAERGLLEIVPMEAPLTLLVWGPNRVLPIQLTSFTITEEAYDVNLNPIQVKVSLNMQVLTYDDLPGKHRGAELFMAHHKAKEKLATQRQSGYSSQNASVDKGLITS
jgi:hypothetical protein